jgi:hypothetical protein
MPSQSMWEGRWLNESAQVEAVPHVPKCQAHQRLLENWSRCQRGLFQHNPIKSGREGGPHHDWFVWPHGPRCGSHIPTQLCWVAGLSVGWLAWLGWLSRHYSQQFNKEINLPFRPKTFRPPQWRPPAPKIAAPAERNAARLFFRNSRAVANPKKTAPRCRLKNKTPARFEPSRGCATCMMDWNARRHGEPSSPSPND